MQKQVMLKLSESHRDKLAEIAIKKGIEQGRHVSMKEIASGLIDKEHKKMIRADK